MRSLSKKGQIETLAPAIIAILMAAIFLILGLVLTSNLRDTTNDVAGTKVVNQSLSSSGVVNDTGTYIPYHFSKCNFNTVSVSACINDSGNVLINSANYTVSDTGLVKFVSLLATDASSFNNTDWNCTYTYNWGDQACISGNATVQGLANFSDFWTIIILAVVISIVIGLLLVVFGSARRKR